MLLGIGVAGTRQPAGPNPVTVVISPAAFAAGAALATPIVKAFGGQIAILAPTVRSEIKPLTIPC